METIEAIEILLDNTEIDLVNKKDIKLKEAYSKIKADLKYWYEVQSKFPFDL